MKTISALVAALGLIAGTIPMLTTSASAETVIIHRGGPPCHMQKIVKFGPHGKTVIIRKVCH